MADRVAGIAFIKVDGDQLPLRGNFKCSPSSLSREGVGGQDGVHGYKEMPHIPSIVGDVTLDPGVSITRLERITNATVTAKLANGRLYVLTEAWAKGPFELDTVDGKTEVAFEGITCEEI